MLLDRTHRAVTNSSLSSMTLMPLRPLVGEILGPLVYVALDRTLVAFVLTGGDHHAASQPWHGLDRIEPLYGGGR